MSDIEILDDEEEEFNELIEKRMKETNYESKEMSKWLGKPEIKPEIKSQIKNEKNNFGENRNDSENFNFPLHDSSPGDLLRAPSHSGSNWFRESLATLVQSLSEFTESSTPLLVPKVTFFF